MRFPTTPDERLLSTLETIADGLQEIRRTQRVICLLLAALTVLTAA